MYLFSPASGLQPYCGAPPTPDALWSRWNLDPWLIAALALGLAVCLIASRRQPIARRLCTLAGWAIAMAALISPLCALSVSLLSARVGQHMMVAAVAAPLVALGLGRSRTGPPFAAVTAAAAFAAILWFWQAPGPYGATFRNPAIYWAMHLSAFAAATWLWSTLLVAARRRPGEAVLAAALTSLQMALLGALLTFAGRPLYAPHLLTTAAWGLTPLADQQLAGVIMWIPAGLVLTVAVVAGLARLLEVAELGSNAREMEAAR